MKRLANFFSLLGSNLHLRLYSSQVLKPIQIKTPVLSIGNLSAGGTGKTPVVIDIAKAAISRKLSVGIVCRSYKATQKQPMRLSVSDPVRYGDEASLIFEKVPEAIVYSGESKWMSAQSLEVENPKVNLIIVDDGFQHLKLKRDFDLVLIDSSLSYDEFRKSWLRESLEALKRADCVLFTKWNEATEKNKNEWLGLVKNQIQDSESKIGMVSAWPRLNPKVKSETSLLVTGIANPIALTQKFVWGKVQELSDHHQYTSHDVLNLENQAKKLGFKSIVTTEKDWVKIKKLGPQLDIWTTVELNLVWERKAQDLEDFLDSFHR